MVLILQKVHMFAIDIGKISGFHSYLATSGKQKATVDCYTRDLANFLQFLEAMDIHSGDIGLKVLEEYKTWLTTRGSKANSIRRAIIAIRMFFRWQEETGELHGNPFDEAVIPSHESHAARVITAEKIDLMTDLARAGETALKSARDIVLLSLLSREGLKSTEIVSLTWTKFFAAGESGRLSISGDKARTIGLEIETTLALKAYRKILQEDPRTGLHLTPLSPILVSFKGADARAVQFGITRHGLKFAIYELGLAAEIPRLNAEQLRHVAMSHKLSIGFTPDMVMNHLGLRRVGNIGKHISVPTT
jgi:integrase/recombinase XerD